MKTDLERIREVRSLLDAYLRRLARLARGDFKPVRSDPEWFTKPLPRSHVKLVDRPYDHERDGL